MRVQIITNDNSYGMSQDIAVLRGALVGISGTSIEVVYNHWQAPVRGVPAKHYDLNIFGEFLNPAFNAQAKRNVFVPNPEWFWHSQHLRGMDQVWAKTRDCERIFQRHHKNVKYIGWTSADRLLRDVPKEKIMVHLAGASSAKGTRQVIDAMRTMPEHRLLLATTNQWGVIPPNVDKVGRLDDQEFVTLQNRAAIHLCPSSYEGFGHYINEARSVGACIVTTNAEPMTDLVGPSFGFGAGVASISTQNFAIHQHVDTKSLAEMIQAAMALPLNALLNLGLNARAAYLAGREEFFTNLKTVL